jgi:signal transduction histidine kinase/DNA-binding response OmpR family regulator
MLEPDGTARILVVDDREDKLLVYRSILEDLGQTLVTARSGEEALAHVLRASFAVILLDVQMPGMDGLETAALIRTRKRSAHTPIIFLTAFDELRAAEGYATGAVDYMTTPVVPEVLRAKVRVFVDLYHLTQQVRKQAEERVALAEERSRRQAAEGENRRLAFLAEASRVLAGSLDPAVIADAVARLPVPALGDLAGLTVVPDDGGPWRTDLAWVCPPDPAVFTRRLTAADGPNDPLREAVERALATGRPEQLDGLDVPFPVAADCDRPADRIRAAAVFPLLARDRTRGALTLAFAGERRLAPADFVLARDLAARAAVALDNAGLHHAVQLADRQKNEFLAMLAHELRNPLAPLRNAVEVLRHSPAPSEVVRETRELIDRQVTHLARLVDDLLDVGRITRGAIRLQTEPLDLAALVAQVVDAARPLTDVRRHAVELALADRPAVVVGDPTRLAQVVTNLLANAAKYTDEGGRIRVAVEADPGEVRVRVRDTGVGLPAHMLSAVFDLFTQVDQSLDRSQGGLGIGLTLVKKLAEMHGGGVAAHSDGPGTGCEFTVRLPPAPPGVAPPARTPAAADPARPLRVVVVDDNTDAADSLAGLLELLGHRAAVAYTGPDGLAAVRRDLPDLAILDLGLPGMDGYELARRLRDDPATRGLVLAAVSGYGRDEDRARSRTAGFDHHFLKPLEFDALQTLLRSVRPPAPK